MNSLPCDLHRDQPLFEKNLLILCNTSPSSTTIPTATSSSSTNDDNYEMNINLRILQGYRGHHNHNQQEKILYFEITNDNDYYFLYSFEICENDFHNLKRDQRLIIDFHGFSKKFIDLIQLCINTRTPLERNHGMTSQYFAKMDFHTSNDTSIKAYLAQSLKLSLTRYEILQNDYENLNQECLAIKRLNREQTTDLRTIRETTDREIHLLATKHSQELNLLQQNHLEQLESLRLKWENESTELKSSHERFVRELQSKFSSLEQSYSDLSKEKLELEYSLKQHNLELEKLRPECQFYKNSFTELQETMRTKDKERYQLEQELARSVARREALELQISDKEEIVQKSTSLRNASEQSRLDALKQVEVYSTALSALQEKFKAAVNEINKGNETLRRLQTDNQSLKEKISNKNEIIRRQENMIQEQKDHLNELNRKNLSLQENIELLNQKKALLDKELIDCKKQVVESAKLIQDNEKVITHLNELLTDFQLGGTGRGISTPAYGKYQSYSGSPVMTPYDRNQQQYYDPQHEDHQRNELNDTAPTPSSNYVPVSSTRNTTIPYNRTPPSQRNDNVDYLFSDKRASTGKKEVEFDLLLTPNQTNKLSQHGGGAIAGSVGASKGYYDGLLDIPVIPSASTRPAGITPYREEKTSLRSPGKKPVYSWSLPGFGLEDESGVPSTTPSAAVK